MVPSNLEKQFQKSICDWRFWLAIGTILIAIGGILARITYDSGRITHVETTTTTLQLNMAKLDTKMDYIVNGVDEIKRDVKHHLEESKKDDNK